MLGYKMLVNLAQSISNRTGLSFVLSTIKGYFAGRTVAPTNALKQTPDQRPPISSSMLNERRANVSPPVHTELFGVSPQTPLTHNELSRELPRAPTIQNEFSRQFNK